MTATITLARTGRVKQVLASVVLLVATIGVPAGLVMSVGWPLPSSPSAVSRLPLLLSQPLASGAVVDVLAVVAWLAWVHFTAGVLVELVNATLRRRRPQLRLPLGGPSHDVARSLVIAALLVGVTTPVVAAPVAAVAVEAAPPTVSTAPVATTTVNEAGGPTGTGEATPVVAAATGSSSTGSSPTGSVQGRDVSAAPAGADEREPVTVPAYVVPAPAAGRYACLWDIAEEQLGDGTRWTEIHDLNSGLLQPDGQTLTDPDLIHPGWRLILPADALLTATTPTANISTGSLASMAETSPAVSVPAEHVVVRGDTLWAIAETELGDGTRYDELAAAATTLTQPDGQVLRDPDVLQPGWTIPLPTEAPSVDDAPAVTDVATSAQEPAPGPTPHDAGGELPPADSLPAPPRPPTEEGLAHDGATEAAEDERRGDTVEAPAAAPELRDLRMPEASQRQDDPSSGLMTDRGEAHDTDSVSDVVDAAPSWALPGLSGAGTMLAGALLLLLHQHRRRQSRLRRPGRTLAPPDSRHEVVEKSVRAHTHTATSIERLDQILRRLATACLRNDDALPAVVAVTLDRTGITLHLATPNPATDPGTVTEPWTAADPWTVIEPGTSGPHPMTWHLPADADLDQVGPLVPDQPAPYPLLVTVGATPTGVTTMLNLEHLGVVTVTGDRQRGEDLLRYVAAEVGCNPWSEAARAHCVGIATELGPLNPERIRVAPTPDHLDHAAPRNAELGRGPAGTVDPVPDLTADAVAAVDRSTHLDLDVPEARIRQAGEETWPPHLLLLGGGELFAGLDTLTDLIRSHPARTGTTVLVLAPASTATTSTDADEGIEWAPASDADRVRGPAPFAGGSAAAETTLHLDPAAQLTVTGPAGIVITGVTSSGLSAAEAQGCAAIFALGPADAPMPTPHADSHGWRAYADAAGALGGAHTLPRHDLRVTRQEEETDDGWAGHGRLDVRDHDRDDDHDRPAHDDPEDAGGNASRNDGGNDGGNDERELESTGYGPDTDAPGREAQRTMGAASVLGGPDEEYLDIAATTRADLEALAPSVPAAVSRAVADSDPGLDDDLAAWFAGSSTLPRLTLLGPVGARTRGVPVTKRKPYYTELLTFLATRPHGATPEEVAAAFDITATKARGYVATVRDWLGTNPRTGLPHIPDARHSPAAVHRGVGVYEVQDLLVDVDLFRRLRLRGQTRGPDGIHDLTRALTLVTGAPFSRLRPGGWTWLVEGDRIDQHMLCAVVDVAHLVTTHLLQTGDLPAARATAELAALAAPDEEIPRLDLAAVAMASGHCSTAADIIQTEVCNRTDDAGAPDELSARTHDILERHGWLTDARQAAS